MFIDSLLSVWLLLNSGLLIVKFSGNQKFYPNFHLGGVGLAPLMSALSRVNCTSFIALLFPPSTLLSYSVCRVADESLEHETPWNSFKQSPGLPVFQKDRTPFAGVLKRLAGREKLKFM